MAEGQSHHTLGDKAAFQLANVTKTPPQYEAITPRWLIRLLDWKPLEAGTLRVNRVVDEKSVEVVCDQKEDKSIPESFVNYEEKPREYTLNSISAVLDVQTKVSDLYSTPYDQIAEQLRLTIETVKERQESEIINNDGYGLLKNVPAGQRIKTRTGPPTPDDLDELLTKVWKEPSFFLAHPRAIAAFGRECTRRGVPPPTVTLFGTPFLTWRGVPLIPCDKLHVDGQARSTGAGGRSNILLMRVGEKKQGVIGLYQPGLPGEQTPGLSVRFMGINRKAIASYLVSLYCSAAVLIDDAIACLENVDVGSYHDYKYPFPEGLPDAAVLQRMAQQVYGDLAGRSVALEALPAATDPRASMAAVQQGLPFSFLEDARPLFTAMPAVAMPQVAGVAAPMLPLATPPEFLEVNRLASVSANPVLSPALGGLPPLSSTAFDVGALRRDFPILQETVNGRPLIWLDNAATTQKPQSVIDRVSHFYAHENSNIHRAAHELAARATDAYEAAREKVRRFLNASSTKEIVFVRGTTEGINLVSQGWGRRHVGKDDEIVITWLEHHANIVPWQMLCAEKGARLRVAPVDDRGQVLLDEYEKLLGPRTRLVSIAHVSNALGTVTPVGPMVAAAKRYGARVLVDGAQAVSHLGVDVQALDCDFYVFSGHKIFAPTGIGVVYGRPDVLSEMPPWQGGGNMIADVTFEKTLYQEPPARFEAGTPSIGDAVGLGAALDYLDRVGMVNVGRYEHELLVYAMESMQRIPGLRLIGTAADKASVLSFVLDGYRSEDVGSALNAEGIAVRSGHHCAQPILRRFGVETTVRPSLALYNTFEEVDVLCATLWNLKGGRRRL